MPKNKTREQLEKDEIKRLKKVYEGMPPKARAVADGLIVQAARLRVQLNELNADIQENGLTELFTQSEKIEPYTRTRPEAELFIKADKSYQAIIRQLTELIPTEDPVKDDLDAFRNG